MKDESNRGVRFILHPSSFILLVPPMTLFFTPPPRTTSPLSRLDPRETGRADPRRRGRRRGPHAGRRRAALAGAAVLAVLGRLPPRWWATGAAPAVLFVAVFAVPPIFFGRGAETALVLACKAAALVTLILVLLATAPLDATLKAAHGLRVPGLLVQSALLSYRYLFVLAEELGRLRVALRRAATATASMSTATAPSGPSPGAAGSRLGAGGASRPGDGLPRLRRHISDADRVPHHRGGRADVDRRRRGGRRGVAGLGDQAMSYGLC